MSEILEWVGSDEAENLSAMAYKVLFEVYTYIPVEGIQKFYDETQTSDAIRKQISDGYKYAFVIDGGERIGYISYVVEGDEMEFSKYYILDGHRGQGIGSMVLDQVISIARDMKLKRIFLHVNKLNDGGIRIYKRKGFKEVRFWSGYNTIVLDMDLVL
jgi:ribosomal protein S18 acetylase RimI-like enzyme